MIRKLAGEKPGWKPAYSIASVLAMTKRDRTIGAYSEEVNVACGTHLRLDSEKDKRENAADALTAKYLREAELGMRRPCGICWHEV
jgi:hypothetical protein